MVDITPDTIDHTHDHHPTGWRSSYKDLKIYIKI